MRSSVTNCGIVARMERKRNPGRPFRATRLPRVTRSLSLGSPKARPEGFHPGYVPPRTLRSFTRVAVAASFGSSRQVGWWKWITKSPL